MISIAAMTANQMKNLFTSIPHKYSIKRQTKDPHVFRNSNRFSLYN